MPIQTHCRPAGLSLRPLHAALLALLLLTGCATTVISPELEGELGAEMSHDVEDQIGLYVDPELQAYVTAVGQRLVGELGATPYTFRFAVVDQHAPNAFASLGGYVYLSRGLLAQMNSEAELAGVLAHEISHVTQRHHARQVGRSVGAGLFTLPGKAIGVINEDLGNIINTPVEAVGKVYLSSYSRGQETEADEYGMALAAKAGYEPTALVAALEGIERSAEYLSGEHRDASFFDSHPTTPTRVADITEKAAAMARNPGPPIASNPELANHLDGLWWGPQNPQQGVFQDQVYLNADFDFRLAFEDEWKTVNSPRFVGASAPDGGAYIALGGAASDQSINELADGLEAKMRERAGIEPTERRELSLGEWPAQLVRYDDTSGEETASLYYLFVSIENTRFTVMSMGLERYREVLRKTVLSLRQLTPQERKSIGGQRLRIADVRPGETLSSFGERVDNQWSPELTEIINGIDPGEPLETGRRLKLVHHERYIPE